MRIRPLVVSTLVLAGSSVAGFILWNRLGGATVVDSSTAASSSVEAKSPAAPPAPAAATAPKRDVDGTAIPERRTIDDAAQKNVGVDGTVVVVDESGHDHAGESGRVVLKTGPEEFATVAVVDGKFRFEAAEGAALVATGGILRERVAAFDEAAVTVVAGGAVNLRGRWLEEIEVRVIDHATKAPLADVEFVRANDDARETAEPATEAAALANAVHAIPPLRFAARLGTQGCIDKEIVHVGAEAHLWKRVGLDFRKPAPQIVDLYPGARLVVTVTGTLPPSRQAPLDDVAGVVEHRAIGFMAERECVPQLRLRHEDSAVDREARGQALLDRYETAPPEDFVAGVKPPREQLVRRIERGRRAMQGVIVAEMPAKLGESFFDGVAVGDLVVSIERGSRNRSIVAARADVRLEAGVTARAALDVPPVAAPEPPVALAGTIFVPDEWRNVPNLRRLLVFPLDLDDESNDDRRMIDFASMPPVDGRPGWYRFDAKLVRPSRYVLRIDEAAFARVVDVSTSGATDVELRLAPPALLRIRTVDAETSDPAQVGGGFWWPDADAATLESTQPVQLVPSDDPSVLVGTVPTGRGRFQLGYACGLQFVSVGDWLLADGVAVADVHDGEQSIDVAVRRATQLVLSFHAPATGRSPRDRVLPRVEAIAHDGRWVGPSQFGRDPESLVLSFSAAGRYRVTIPPIDGFQPFEPFDVDLPEGKRTEHVVEVVAK